VVKTSLYAVMPLAVGVKDALVADVSPVYDAVRV
jgi:hypothetical protein